MYESAWYCCNQCESVMATAWNVCPMCGTEHRITPEPLRCSRCGLHITSQWGWCPECGAELAVQRE